MHLVINNLFFIKNYISSLSNYWAKIYFDTSEACLLKLWKAG